MTEPNISEEVHFEMLEKKADGTFKAKYPKTKAEQVVYDDGSTAVYHSSYAVASGTNSYTVNIPSVTSLIEGMSIKIKFINANTGASTLNINGLGAKAIQKSNGNALSSGNIKAGQIAHLVYTGSVFQLLGEGGEYGTAQAQDVLEGKTIGTENGIITGTMPNNGAISRTITSQNGQIIIPQGYHNGSGIVKAQFANLIARNIRKGVNVGGVIGSLTPLENVSYKIEEISSDNESKSYTGTLLLVGVLIAGVDWSSYISEHDISFGESTASATVRGYKAPAWNYKLTANVNRLEKTIEFVTTQWEDYSGARYSLSIKHRKGIIITTS